MPKSSPPTPSRTTHNSKKSVRKRSKIYTGATSSTLKPRPKTKSKSSTPPLESPPKPQRRKILRRDGYCCAVPGCPNTLWLEVHHIIYYADGGQTKPDNLITLCTRCHKHLHDGHLTIQNEAPHGARFLNRAGKDLRQQKTLEIAFWLDYWCGWRGSEDEPRYFLARNALAA
ncbi:MAG: HNH endonuclease [Candidatus Eremiobacteraeota bacterium]|nr:HNH endonuclease [Candidatus Eremiobacteraeota bacterium]